MSYLTELRRLVGSRPLFSVGVGVLVLDERGRVLLQRRFDSGLWGLPGGSAEPGETQEQTARRELLEETGLNAPDLHLHGVYSGPEFRHVYPNGDQIYFVGSVYSARLSSTLLATAHPDPDGETLELRLFGLDELPPLNGALDRAALQDLRRQLGLAPSPGLVLPPADPPAPGGNHLRDLRDLVGPRPLFASGANVAVFDDQHRLLLLRHAGTGRWTLPGGSMELGERFEAAAHRELFEETGLRAEKLTSLKLYCGAEYRYTYPHGDVVDNVSKLYLARGVSGDLRMQETEVLEWQHFPLDALPGPDELSGPLIWANLSDLRQWVPD